MTHSILQNKICYSISCLLANTHVPQFTIEMHVDDGYIQGLIQSGAGGVVCLTEHCQQQERWAASGSEGELGAVASVVAHSALSC